MRVSFPAVLDNIGIFCSTVIRPSVLSKKKILRNSKTACTSLLLMISTATSYIWLQFSVKCVLSEITSLLSFCFQFCFFLHSKGTVYVLLSVKRVFSDNVKRINFNCEEKLAINHTPRPFVLHFLLFFSLLLSLTSDYVGRNFQTSPLRVHS